MVLPVAASLMDGLNLVVLILTFFSLYKLLNHHFMPNKLLTLLVVIVITYLVLVPVTWFTWMVFAVVFMLDLPETINRGLFGGGGH
ncbi:MAG: hypothetical protein V1787_04215 [Candidatus Micrarchaeota archaeon]